MPTLLITGANRGIGLELCKQYLNDGWTVHGACRDPDNATRLSVLADKYPVTLTVHALDVGQSEQIESLKKELGDKPIDLLINNAGIYGDEANQLGSIDTEAWLETFKINAISPIKMIEAFTENVASSELKTIANLSSKMGSIADNDSGGCYAYRSSKTALNSALVSTALDLKDKDITVLILHPGWVRTTMGGPNGELSTEESATNLRKIMSNSTIQDSGNFFDIDGSYIPW
ncbi:UNVERIFIED_CONTAM: hypothetical protein GTU68_049988 [Idotea baltica]|nr:hypothetical protein [Idotea baltica]